MSYFQDIENKRDSLQDLQNAGVMVSLELSSEFAGRHKPGAGGFCLDLRLKVIRLTEVQDVTAITYVHPPEANARNMGTGVLRLGRGRRRGARGAIWKWMHAEDNYRDSARLAE